MKATFTTNGSVCQVSRVDEAVVSIAAVVRRSHVRTSEKGEQVRVLENNERHIFLKRLKRARLDAWTEARAKAGQWGVARSYEEAEDADVAFWQAADPSDRLRAKLAVRLEAWSLRYGNEALPRFQGTPYGVRRRRFQGTSAKNAACECKTIGVGTSLIGAEGAI